MASQAERLAVVETRVENLDSKLDTLQVDVKVNHQEIKDQLTKMYEASCLQHSELAKKIGDLEKFRSKAMIYTVVGLAFLAGAGWFGHASIPNLIKFIGL